MRASPAFQFVLSRFALWHAAVAGLAALAAATLIAWLATRTQPVPPLGLLAWGAALVAVAVLAIGSMRVPALVLRWDGRSWWLARPRREADALAGEVSVALDLGGFLLLRFVALSPVAGRRTARWLPVQRRGLEPHWHALRCAVYSPRPAPARDAAGQP
jgi:hypothetical protein